MTLTHWFQTENVTAEDVGLCRNTKPLVETAYAMIAVNLPCRVEGRDIGEGLVSLATKWKRIKALGDLRDRLDEYLTEESAKWTAKNLPSKVQAVEDKVQTLYVIIDNLTVKGLTTVADLVTHIRSLFGDTPDGQKPRVFTLSTIHKAKGREWERVYLIRPDLIPSRYAQQAWQIEQENNLLYVAQTRAKKELVYVDGS